MRTILLLALLLFGASGVNAQHTLQGLVIDEHEGTPLPGANVVLEGSTTGTTTDEHGRFVLTGIPDGPQVIVVSFVGYRSARLALVFPRPSPDEPIEVALEEDEEEMEEAFVTATRTGRTIADTPTRVETIGGEEIEEKIAMDPSGISMLLNESPGIVVQQTSAVSVGSAFRIQGLDGRYTQLLRDGFPLFGGLGSGLSLLQIPPLDLAQVEVIKGPASTLYGGDAIAGLINLVTKAPSEEGERTLLLNASSAAGLDAAAWISGRNERTGHTLLVTGSGQRAYDPDGDTFTNLPAVRRLTVVPTWVRYGAGTLTLSATGAVESRSGGYVPAVQDDKTGYRERNESRRLAASARYERETAGGSWVAKSSMSLYHRVVQVPDARFSGRQTASYSELTRVRELGAHQLIAGVDVRSDRFDSGDDSDARPDFAYTSAAVFGQDTWDVHERLTLEGGLRLESHSEFGTFVLPRLNVLVRPAAGLSLRAGAGLGYKAPSPFLEEAEIRAFRGVTGLGPEVQAERSQGGGLDLNWSTVLGGLGVSFNQAIYATRLDHPLVPVEDGALLRFETGTGHVRSRGAETTLKLSAGDLKLFLGYVLLDADRVASGAEIPLALASRHRTYAVLVWERHGKGRIGWEAYWAGSQVLPDGTETPDYLVTGIMAQWRFGPVRPFLNLENLLDTRQESLVAGAPASPDFAPIWGPTDGFIVNAGVLVDW